MATSWAEFLANGVSEIQLRCPRCASSVAGLECSACAFRVVVEDGIVDALPPERAHHFARFVADYEHIRAAEGRGSESAEYYRRLPWTDVSGKNSEQWRIRARSFDALIRHVIHPGVPHGGSVLDLGAGNCWMSFRLAEMGYCPCAVDLLTNRLDGLGAARHYQSVIPRMFPRVRAELSHLPFRDQQFDAVVFNASFHYAEDAHQALREALRCTKAGGMIVICDTPWYRAEESGARMVAERRARFVAQYGTASDSLGSFEYLTDARLGALGEHACISWQRRAVWYGLRWGLRPLVAKMRVRREPSRFRLYFARKPV